MPLVAVGAFVGIRLKTKVLVCHEVAQIDILFGNFAMSCK